MALRIASAEKIHRSNDRLRRVSGRQAETLTAGDEIHHLGLVCSLRADCSCYDCGALVCWARNFSSINQWSRPRLTATGRCCSSLS